jgi:hypothetical protein
VIAETKDSERAAFGACARCLEIDLIGIHDINREMIVIGVLGAVGEKAIRILM